MMDKQVTESMKAKFCKDMNIPISIYAEPYFGERLALYNRYKPCISDYVDFLKEVEKEASFDDFLKKYNIFKDNVINDLWSKEGIYKLINEDYTKSIREYKVNIRRLCLRICSTVKGYYNENKNKFDFFNFKIVDYDKELEDYNKIKNMNLHTLDEEGEEQC